MGMKRTKQNKKKQPTRIPDVINNSVTKNFTQVPNEVLRNPELSFKAKGLLCLLLSNRDGWYSYIRTIIQMTKEGEDAIRSGIDELEEHKHLIRFRYRDKQTKRMMGSFWAYTDIPGKFYMKETVEMLDDQGFELITTDFERLEFPDGENPDVDSPDVENLGLIIPNNNKTKNKKTNSSSDSAESNGKITPSQFEDFWKLYPRCLNKGKAKTKWEQVCNWSNNKRPTWDEIESALKQQRKTKQWSDPNYIPHPATWLNQQRWLDDPKEMGGFSNRNTSRSKLTQAHHGDPDKEYPC